MIIIKLTGTRDKILRSECHNAPVHVWHKYISEYGECKFVCNYCYDLCTVVEIDREIKRDER